MPVNATTNRIIYQLMHDGRVRRAYLGLVSSPAPLPPAWAERTGQRIALRVVEVVEHSPAEASGLHRGDMVLAVNGTPLGNAGSLQRLLLDDAIGTPRRDHRAPQRRPRRRGRRADRAGRLAPSVNLLNPGTGHTGMLSVATYPSSTEPVTLAICSE